MKWAEHVACIGSGKMHIGFASESQKERNKEKYT
jgi:hypothetical protein